jgi:hypothetical protein
VGILPEEDTSSANPFLTVAIPTGIGEMRNALIARSSICLVAIGGGMDATNIYNLANFLRAVPNGTKLTLESTMRNVLPINMMAIAMGLHVRCGIEDNLWTQDRKAKMGTAKQVEQLVRISREFGRPVATGKEARKILQIGTFYSTIEETLEMKGFARNRKPVRAFLEAAE